MTESRDAPAIAGPLGSMALSQVKPHSSTASLRAIKWHQDLARLGIHLPLGVVHDLGMVLALGQEQVEIGPRCQLGRGHARLHEALAQYRGIIGEANDSEAARRAPDLRMSDDLLTVVLAKLLGPVAARVSVAPAYQAQLPLDGALFGGLSAARLAALWTGVHREYELAALRQVVSMRLWLLTATDALDLDTLRLFGMAGLSDSGAVAQVDLLSSLESAQANDVVNFSLELLPSVLESKPRPAAGTIAAFGYSGLGRRGSIDNMVLTELAWDDLELARRIIDGEVLYYAREQQQEEQGREHLLLIDASASMRGDRATFARAMALATGKKLLLEGEQVSYRFFDSRLYEPHAAVEGALPTAQLLSFVGEHGRNPGRVFSQLLESLELGRAPDRPVLHLFTHAALYVPRELAAQIAKLTPITAMFILPSGGKLDLDYLDLLAAHWVVDHQTLGAGKARARAALDILEGVAPEATPADSEPAAAQPTTSWIE